MSSKRWFRVVLLGTMGLMPVVWAGGTDSVGAQSKREVLPLQQILKHAQALHSGRVIESDLKRRIGADELYEIEILDTHGRVWEMYFNAYDGKLVKTLTEE